MRSIFVLLAVLTIGLVMYLTRPVAGQLPSVGYWGVSYVSDGSTQIDDIGTAYATLTAFTTQTKGHGVDFDADSDIATVLFGGYYLLSFAMTMKGTAGVDFDCSLFRNDTIQIADVHFALTGPQLVNVDTASSIGIAALLAGDTVRVKCKCSTTTGDFIPVNAQLMLLKVE